MPHSEKSDLGTSSEKPREFTLRARFVPGMRVAIPEWVVLATPKAAVPPEDVRVLEADPVERELAELRERAEKAEAERDVRVMVAEDGPGGPISVLICERCGQPTQATCNSGIHVGLGESANGRPVRSTDMANELERLKEGIGVAASLLRSGAFHAVALDNRDAWLAAYCPTPQEENQMSDQLPELVSVPASELRAGDQVLLRVDRVADLLTDIKLVDVETGPFPREQQVLRARHPDGS